MSTELLVFLNSSRLILKSITDTEFLTKDGNLFQKLITRSDKKLLDKALIFLSILLDLVLTILSPDLLKLKISFFVLSLFELYFCSFYTFAHITHSQPL